MLFTVGFTLLIGALAPSPARAASTNWSGRLGPVSVSVWRFVEADDEGAGGWTNRAATAFAAWAARLGDGLPPGVGVDIEEAFGRERAVAVTLLRCRTSDRRCAHPLSRAPLEIPVGADRVELDDGFAGAILAAVAQATGQDLPRHEAVAAPRLYTIQVQATHSSDRARALAHRVDGLYEHDGRYVFDQTCGLCIVTPEARVAVDELAGETVHRVTVGNYESRREARRDLDKLAGLGFAGAVIRPLAPAALPGRRVAATIAPR
jgi:hypothetical protein